MYSTPNASSALAIAILVFVSKNAFANCSPSDRTHPRQYLLDFLCAQDVPRRVLSMIEKFETLLRKSDARGA